MNLSQNGLIAKISVILSDVKPSWQAEKNYPPQLQHKGKVLKHLSERNDPFTQHISVFKMQSSLKCACETGKTFKTWRCWSFTRNIDSQIERGRNKSVVELPPPDFRNWSIMGQAEQDLASQACVFPLNDIANLDDVNDNDNFELKHTDPAEVAGTNKFLWHAYVMAKTNEFTQMFNLWFQFHIAKIMFFFVFFFTQIFCRLFYVDMLL